MFVPCFQISHKKIIKNKKRKKKKRNEKKKKNEGEFWATFGR